MGTPEKAVGSIVDGLKANPLCLAVVVLSGAMMAFAYFSLQAAEARKAQAVSSLIERCFPLQGRGKE